MLSRLSPSYVYFMSGICASAGVNLLTALPSIDLSLVRMSPYLISAGLWVVAAWICAHLGMLVESCHIEAASLSDPTLSRQEVRSLVAAAINRRRGRAVMAAVGAMLAATVALSLGAISRRDGFHGAMPQSISSDTRALGPVVPMR